MLIEHVSFLVENINPSVDMKFFLSFLLGTSERSSRATIQGDNIKTDPLTVVTAHLFGVESKTGHILLLSKN